MKNRLSPFLLAPLALTLLALAGCDAKPAGSSTQAQVKPVRLGYFANLTHAQAVLGVDNGDFAKAVAPAALETKVFNAGPSLVEALFAGEIDIGYVGPGPAINAFAKSKGKGIRIIAGAAANGVVIVAGPNSGIKTLADLKGKKIATPQLGNTQDIAARWHVTRVLGETDAGNVMPIPNAEQAQLLKNGQVAAAWAPEPWGTRLVKEAGGTLIAEEKDLWPGGDFSLTVVVTTPEFLAAHPDTVKAFLAAHRRLTAQLAADPAANAAAVAAGIAKLTGKTIPESLVAEALPRVKFTDDPLPSTLVAQADHAAAVGVLKEKAKLDGLVVAP